MREFPFACTACAADFPAAAELAAHLEREHAPKASEPFLEVARRVARAGVLEDQVVEPLGRLAIPELGETTGPGARLERLRTAGAAAIAGEMWERLAEVRAELEALHREASEERKRWTRIADLAGESADVVAGVLELYQERSR